MSDSTKVMRLQNEFTEKKLLYPLKFWHLYIYLFVIAVPMIFAFFYFLEKNPQFLERRTRKKEKNVKQQIIQSVINILIMTSIIMSGLDQRFFWSDIPIIIIVLSNITILVGYLIIFNVFKQNGFASRIVEVENNQEVITTGLYGIIRHPMYAGVLLMFIPTPLALGSLWGLIPILILPMAFVFRIINEENLLLKELPGYKDYCKKTRYRLIPFIW